MIVFLALWACWDGDRDGTGNRRDCNDLDPSIHLDAVEVCDGVDNDCDGQIDEGVALVAYLDRDGDGFGQTSQARRVCELPDNGSLLDGDCDDQTAAVNPDAVERCDGIDNNCDGQVDEGVQRGFFADEDGDGQGVPGLVDGSAGCFPDVGFAWTDDDCDDADPDVFTGAPERCNGLDDNCDGAIDEGLVERVGYLDRDGDGAGDPATAFVSCGEGPFGVDNGRDCDDADPNRGPAAAEQIGNGIDDDCDGYEDEREIPTAYPDLPTALAAAPDGAVLQFREGIFFGPFDLRGRQVTLAGSGCEQSVLLGAVPGSILQMDAGTVAGLTLSGGEAERGGGLMVGRGTVAVESVCFVDNVAHGDGGAIWVGEGVVTLDDVSFTHNQAGGEGGAFFGDGATLHGAHTHFLDNHAARGGAVAVHDSTVSFKASTFVANGSTGRGGAIWAEAARVEVLQSTLHRNDGEGVIYQDLGLLSVERTVFSGSDTEAFRIETGTSLQQRDNGITGTTTIDVNKPRWLDVLRERPIYVSDDDVRQLPSPVRAAGIGAWVAEEPDWMGLPARWRAHHGLPLSAGPNDDTDQDGLTNREEWAIGTSPTSADADDDGVEDAIERTLGHDPTDPRDQLPVADAGTDRSTLTGVGIVLDGGGSYHPRGLPLGVRWQVTAGPAGHQARVDGGLQGVFVADLAGRYTVSLQVDAGRRVSRHRVQIEVFDGVVVPDDAPTLLEALDLSDVVGLRAGVHLTPSSFPLGQDVRILGLEPGVTLSPSRPGPVIELDGDLHLADLTVAGGRNPSGAGGLQVDGAVVLERVALVDNHGTLAGAGFITEGLTGRGVAVLRNQGVTTGGLRVQQGVDLADSRFEENLVTGEVGAQALRTDNGQVTLERCVFAHHRGPTPVVAVSAGAFDVRKSAWWGNDGVALTDSAGTLFAEEVLFEGSDPPPFRPDRTLSVQAGASADLRPVSAVLGDDDNVWTSRLGASTLDQGWVERPDGDGSRSDHAASRTRPSAGRFALDVDQDGLSDGWEAWMGLDPTQDDSDGDLDGDGLTNALEHALGSRPDRADTDGDGVGDAQDGRLLDPADHQPVAVITRTGGGTTRERMSFDAGLSTDPDGDALTTRWRFLAGPGPLPKPTDEPSWTFEPMVAGTYVVELVVSDGRVDSRPAEVRFEVGETVRVPEDAPTLSQAIGRNTARVLFGPGVHAVEGRLFQPLRLEGGPDTRLRGHVAVVATTLTVRGLRWEHSIHALGGALSCDRSVLTLEHVHFQDNVAARGGALALTDCDTTLRNVDMVGNQAAEDGGALLLTGGRLWASGGSVLGNQAGTHGGGWDLNNGQVEIHNLVFTDNQAQDQGGALSETGGKPIVANHLSLFGNEAQSGSAVHLATSAALANSVVVGRGAMLEGTLPSRTLMHDLEDGPFEGVAWFREKEGTPDLRLIPGSDLQDAADGFDPDGTSADLGAFGGALAPAGWDQWLRTPQGDPDGDGLVNQDEFSVHTHPQRRDTDGDGRPDGTDAQPNVYGPIGSVSDDEVEVGEAVLLSNDANWQLRQAPGRSALPAGPLSTGRLDPDAPGAYALTATSPAGSTHWVVRVRGTVQVPEDYDSVQEAVDAAAAGDTVLVGAGVYPGPVRVSRAVRIVGSGAAVTVLDGAAEGSTLLVEAPLLLEALTLRGGQALRGGGLHALAGVDLLQVDLRDNLAVHGGGLALQAGLTGAEVRVLDNRAIQHGGALWAQNTTADLDTVHVAGAVAAVGSLLWARGSQLRFQHLLAVDGVSTGAPMQIEGGLLHVDFATFGHLTGQPGLIQAAGSDVRWSGVYVVGGEAPLFVVSSPPSLSGGAFFDVDPTAESFPIGPLDPGFDFGPLSPDGDWANDVWGRDQNLPEGAFGPALP